MTESGVASILCKKKFEWIGFFANEETHVCPSELANDGINGNIWSLEKGEQTHWYYQSSHISHIEENENHYVVLHEENAPKPSPKWWHVHRIVS